MKKIALIFFIALMALILPFVAQAASPPSCELDGSCCDFTVGAIDNLCWRNDTWNWSDMNYSVWQDYTETNAETRQLHYHGGDFSCNNPNSFGNYKGACEEFRSSNQPFGYAWNVEGGSISRMRWLPHKLMGYININSPFAAYFELEKTADRRYLVNHYWARCKDNDNCDVGTDAVRLRANSLPAAYAYVTDIDGSYCGLRVNATFSTSYEPSHSYEAVNVVYPCPDNVSFSTNYYANYNLAKDAELELFSIMVVTKVDGVDLGTEAGISDWIGNFSNKTAEIAEEYQAYMDAYLPPTGFAGNDTAIQKYWDGFYAPWFSSFKQVDDTDTTDPFYAYGYPHEIMTPNFEGYYGQWIWDSFTESLHIMSHLNPNVTDGYARDKVKWAAELWANKSAHYPTESTWYQSIRPTGLKSPSQPADGWMLTALNAYNRSIINQTFLCDDFYPALRSHYEATASSRTSDWKFNNINGRDASDAVYLQSGSGTYNMDAGGFFAMASISMFSIAKTCGEPNATQQYFLSSFENVTATFDSIYWNADIGNYWNVNSSNLPYLHMNGGAATTPMGSCFAVAMGQTTQAQTESIVTSLRNNFTDTYGLTSIMTDHGCYDPDGTDLANCVGGGTWDGATWIGIDNFWCINALMQAKDHWNITGLEDDISWLINLTKATIHDSNTNFGAESYASDTAAVNTGSLWGSNPYGGWAMTLPTSPTDLSQVYNVFSVLDFSGVTTAGNETPPAGGNETNFTASYGYSFAHPYLFFNSSDVAQIIAVNNDSSSITYDRWDQLVNQASDYTVAECSGTVWTRPQYMERMAFVGYVLNDTNRMDKALDCLKYWVNNYTLSSWDTESVHATVFAGRSVGSSYDWLYNHMTADERTNLSAGIFNIIETMNSDFTDVTTYGAGNGRGLRGNLLTMCFAILPDDNRSEQYCGDSQANWTISIDGYIGGYKNSSYPTTPDGAFGYENYGRRGVASSSYAHDRLVDMGYNATKWADKYDPTMNGWLYEDMGFTIDVTALTGTQRYDWNTAKSPLNYIYHIAWGESTHYEQALPDLVMWYCAATDTIKSECLWYYNFTVQNSDQYVLASRGYFGDSQVWLDPIIYAKINGTAITNPANTLNKGLVYDAWDRVLINNYGFASGETPLVVSFQSGDTDIGGHEQAHDGAIAIYYDGNGLIDDLGTACNDDSRGERAHATLMVNSKSHERWSSTCTAYDWQSGDRATGCGQAIYGTVENNPTFANFCPDGSLSPNCKYDYYDHGNPYNANTGEGFIVGAFASPDGKYAHGWGNQGYASVTNQWRRNFLMLDHAFVLYDFVETNDTVTGLNTWELTFPTLGTLSESSGVATVSSGDARLDMHIGFTKTTAAWDWELNERPLYFDKTDCSLNSSAKANSSILKLTPNSTQPSWQSMVGGYIYLAGNSTPTVTEIDAGDEIGLSFNYGSYYDTFVVDKWGYNVQFFYNATGQNYTTDSNGIVMRHSTGGELRAYSLQAATFFDDPVNRQFNASSDLSTVVYINDLNLTGYYRTNVTQNITVYYGAVKGDRRTVKFYRDGVQLTGGEYSKANFYVTFEIAPDNESFAITVSAGTRYAPFLAVASVIQVAVIILQHLRRRRRR